MAVGATNYPAALDDATTLIRAVNLASSTIDTGGVTSSAPTIPVVSTAAFAADGIAWCGTEAISYTGKTATTLTGCTRGFDNTAQAAHAAGDPIYGDPATASRFTVLQNAIIAAQTKLGTGADTPVSGEFLMGTGTGVSAWQTAGLDALADVAIISAAQGQILAHNGTQFVNRRGETYNAKDFGGIGDGSDHPLSGVFGTLGAAQAVYPRATALTEQIDYHAIMKALDAAGSFNTVVVPGGRWRVDRQIQLGNGSSTTASTINGVSLIGEGMGWMTDESSAVTPARGSTTLEWVGAAGDPVVMVQGPMFGVHVRDMQINCQPPGAANQAGYGVIVAHAVNSEFRRIQIANYGFAGFWMTAYPSPTNIANGCNGNTVEQIQAGGSGVANGAAGMILGSNATGSSPQLDVALNTIINCNMHAVSGANNIGLLLQHCDNNTFMNCFFLGGATGGGLQRLSPSGTGGTDWPSGNRFFGCHFSPSETGGTPIGGKDVFWPAILGDNGIMPVNNSVGMDSDGKLYGITVVDEAYNATSWNGSLGIPTKNAVRDKLEAGVTPTPAGSTGQLQYNNAGVMAGAVNLTYDGTAQNISDGSSVYRFLCSGGVNYIQSGLTLTGGSAAPLSIGSIFGAAEWLNIASTAVTASVALITAAGTTTLAPLRIPSGALLTTPVAGVVEYDGNSFYHTGNTTSGRGLLPGVQKFELAADGSSTSVITDYFGTNSAFPYIANSAYELIFYLWYRKGATAATTTFTLTSTSAPVRLNADYIHSAAAGMGTAAAPLLAAVEGQTGTAVALPATASLTINTDQFAVVHAYVETHASTAGNIRLRITGTNVTPQAGSYYTVRRVPKTGTYAA